MTGRFSRRRFLVDWKLQTSLCAHSLLYGGLVIATLCCGIFAPLLWNLDDPSRGINLEEQAIVMLYMHERFWFLAALCAIIVVLGAVKFSHRIAGPLVRYKRNLRLLALGKLPGPLRTRPGDHLRDEVACLNAAVAGVAERIDAIAAAHATVRRELHAIAGAGPSVSCEALVAASSELQRCLAAFEHVDTGDDHLPEPVERTEGLVLQGSGVE